MLTDQSFVASRKADKGAFFWENPKTDSWIQSISTLEEDASDQI